MRLEDIALFRFPLFAGMSRSELLSLAGTTKIDFLRLAAGKQIVREGDKADRLFFLVKGTVVLTRRADSGAYRIEEKIIGPWMFEAEALFGNAPCHTFSVSTLESSQLVVLSKDDVVRLLSEFLVLRINFINLLSTLARRHAHAPFRTWPDLPEKRIVSFLLSRVCYPAGEKTLFITMPQLAHEVGLRRQDVSKALHEMERRGLVSLRRSRIMFASIEKLFTS